MKNGTHLANTFSVAAFFFFFLICLLFSPSICSGSRLVAHKPFVHHLYAHPHQTSTLHHNHAAWSPHRETSVLLSVAEIVFAAESLYRCSVMIQHLHTTSTFISHLLSPTLTTMLAQMQSQTEVHSPSREHTVCCIPEINPPVHTVWCWRLWPELARQWRRQEQ